MNKKSPHNLNLLRFEIEARKAGYQRVVGVDEAGRGPLAGPVFAACCHIEEGLFFEGVNDSKLLTPKEREAVVVRLSKHPGVRFGIGYIDAEVIDEINILQATVLAMRQALDQLPEKPDIILVDGPVPLSYAEVAVKKIIKGDQLSLSIAAASNFAKVSRDLHMHKMHEKYPEYRFDKHKGYATTEHREILSRIGPSPIHRKTFSYR